MKGLKTVIEAIGAALAVVKTVQTAADRFERTDFVSTPTGGAGLALAIAVVALFARL